MSNRREGGLHCRLHPVWPLNSLQCQIYFFHVSRSRSLYAVARPSIICLSVTLVHPTQAVVIFRNISAAFGTLAIPWHPRKILRRSSQGNPSVGGVKQRIIFWSIGLLRCGRKKVHVRYLTSWRVLVVSSFHSDPYSGVVWWWCFTSDII